MSPLIRVRLPDPAGTFLCATIPAASMSGSPGPAVAGVRSGNTKLASPRNPVVLSERVTGVV
jgi:hypothetical protein